MTEEMCMDDDGDDRRELSGARRPDDLQSTKEEGWGWGDGFPWTPFGVFNGVAGDCTGRDDRVGHPNQVPGGGGDGCQKPCHRPALVPILVRGLDRMPSPAMCSHMDEGCLNRDVFEKTSQHNFFFYQGHVHISSV